MYQTKKFSQLFIFTLALPTFVNGYWDKLLVASGSDEAGSRVVDLSDSMVACDSYPTHPLNVIYAQGGLLNQTTPVICGGQNKDAFFTHEKFCYTLGDPTPLVKLDVTRENFASVVQYFDMLWITGGVMNEPGQERAPLKTSVYVTLEDDEVLEGPEMPIPLFYHCMTWFQGKVMILGGLTDNNDPESFNKQTFFYDPFEDEWSTGPDLDIASPGPVCNVFNDFTGNTENYAVLVVAFAGKTFLWFDGDDNWTIGPDPPVYVSPDAKSIVTEPNDRSFVLIEESSMYRLQCSNRDCNWRQTSNANIGSRFGVPMLIPDEMADCRFKNFTELETTTQTMTTTTENSGYMFSSNIIIVLLSLILITHYM